LLILDIVKKEIEIDEGKLSEEVKLFLDLIRTKGDNTISRCLDIFENSMNSALLILQSTSKNSCTFPSCHISNVKTREGQRKEIIKKTLDLLGLYNFKQNSPITISVTNTYLDLIKDFGSISDTDLTLILNQLSEAIGNNNSSSNFNSSLKLRIDALARLRAVFCLCMGPQLAARKQNIGSKTDTDAIIATTNRIILMIGFLINQLQK
jgi:hypothetical protein